MPIERFFKGAKIAHIHVATGKSFIRKTIIIYWAWILGYKVIYHCHGAETKTYFESIGLNRAKRILSKCVRIVVLSKSWQDYFIKTFDRTDVDVINNIVEERINDGEFVEIAQVEKPQLVVNISDKDIHSYRIIAANKGGKSFPSEVLALCDKGENAKMVTVVNGFTRV